MRTTIQSLPASKIREVANAGLGRSDVLAFWFGESDEVTPEPIRAAAAKALGLGLDVLALEEAEVGNGADEGKAPAADAQGGMGKGNAIIVH